MALSGVALMRVQKELKMIYEEPPPGISAWAREDNLRELEAGMHSAMCGTQAYLLSSLRPCVPSDPVVQGAEGTPYANGRFRLHISMPLRYPFEPPKVQFITPIYHPNIDSAGRICLDTLNLPPKGAWKPSLNISTVLSSLQLLMSEPNPDDGLMVDITHQYIHDHAKFERTAAEHTRRHAMGSDSASASGSSESACTDEAQQGRDDHNTDAKRQKCAE